MFRYRYESKESGADFIAEAVFYDDYSYLTKIPDYPAQFVIVVLLFSSPARLPYVNTILKSSTNGEIEKTRNLTKNAQSQIL